MNTYTTGQVAKLCHVSTRTVCKWFDNGKLKGARQAKAGHRLIRHDSLLTFLKETGRSCHGLRQKTDVLLVTQDKVLIQEFYECIARGDGCINLKVVGYAYLADTELNVLLDCVIVDFSIDPAEAAEFCKYLRLQADSAQVRLIAVLPEEGSESLCLDGADVSEVHRKPLSATFLLERLQAVTEVAASPA